MPASARLELIQARNVLLRRRASTTDEAERRTIDEALDELNDGIETIDAADLLQAAGRVARAGDAMERVVASARMGPFDNFLADVQAAIAGLQSTLDAMQATDRLPPAPVEAEATPVAAAGSESTRPPEPLRSRKFDELRDEYAAMFDRCRLLPQFSENAEFYVSRLIRFKPAYQQLGDSLGMPWSFIGVIHGMECGFNFSTHLHNGDPLSAHTVRVPRGRPVPGEPPFTWLDSARDALVMKSLDRVTDWTLPHMLHLLEAFNGFGYRDRGVPTPYLWSFSNLYSQGKFVADGVFDPQAVSRQCGAAVMLRVLQERGQA